MIRLEARGQGMTDGPQPGWRSRKEASLVRLAAAERSALLVTAADTLDDALSIVDDLAVEGQATLARSYGGFEGAAWYFTAMYKLFDRRFALGDPARVLVRRLGREAQQITRALRIAKLERADLPGT